MTTKLHWGIIGAGGIAGTFARSLARSEHGVRYAVGSRSIERAEAFAREFACEAAYGSYADLLADPKVDAVYVATPHTEHRDCVLAAARAGKHILCEKPLGVTVAECEEMIAAAAAGGVVLLEAFMYRTHPQTTAVMSAIEEGAIGRVQVVRSHFHYKLGDDYNVRLDRSLRGGGLYDVGCYCINFSRMVAGEEPDRVRAVWILGAASGVDEALAASLYFPSGMLALFDVGIRTPGGSAVEVVGTEGSLLIPRPWKPDPQRAACRLVRPGQDEREIVVEGGGDAFVLEADHLAEVITGACEPLIPASNASGNAAVMDRIWREMHG